MMHIILAIVIFILIASVFVVNNDNSYVLIEDKFNKKIRYTTAHMGFKKPFPIERVIARIPIEKTITKYIEIGENGMDFELSFKVHDPLSGHIFLNYFDEYVFEFIYNVYNLDMTKEEASKAVFDKLSKGMNANGVTLKSFEFK
jgi:hypothetical protein